MPAKPESKLRRFFRVWFPIGVIALSIVGIGVLQAWPSAEFDPGFRNGFTLFIFEVGLLLMAVWLLFFSGLRWYVRIGTLVAIVAVCVAAIEKITFTGDMAPTFHWRWLRDHARTLEQHRQAQGQAAAPIAIEAEKATDYPEYRNRKRDGIVTGPPLRRDWKANPPKELWRQPVGSGYAGMVVQGNIAVTIEQRRGEEVVAAYNTATGLELWTNVHPARFSESLGGEGPRATPTISDGKVYSLGATGHLVCLDLTTGKSSWSAEILEGNKNLEWAMAGSPLVYDNFVVVNPGAQLPEFKGKALVAYDKTTGKVAWTSGDTQAGYSSPQLATLGGRRQILLLDGERMAGFDAKDGKELWSFPFPPFNGINVAQPLVLEGDRVFITSGYNIGCAMLKVAEKDGSWSATEVWRNKNMRCKFASPVLYKGHIYGLDEGILCCLDPETGKRVWRDGRYGHGQILLQDDVILVMAETGKLALVQATPEAFRELGSIQVFNESKTWNHHALSNGKAYLRNHVEMAAFDLTQP